MAALCCLLLYVLVVWQRVECGACLSRCHVVDRGSDYRSRVLPAPQCALLCATRDHWRLLAFQLWRAEVNLSVHKL